MTRATRIRETNASTRITGRRRRSRASAMVSRGIASASSYAWGGTANGSDATAGMGMETGGTAGRIGAKATGKAGRMTLRGIGNTADLALRIEGRVERAAPVRLAKIRKAGRTGARWGKGLGSAGLNMLEDTQSRIAGMDADDISRIGSTSSRMAVTAGRKAVSATGSFARTMWRHRKTPAKAVRTGRNAARAATRAARMTARLARAVATRAAAAVASISLPMLPMIAAILAVVMLMATIMAGIAGLFSNATVGVRNVPDEYASDVMRAGSVCAVVTPAVIAAQIEAESAWNPTAGSPAGAQGIAQFMPSTWSTHGMDGDGDGRADILNPHDAIWSQGNYMCQIAGQIDALKATGAVSGDTLRLALAAYNAGLGNVTGAGGIPAIGETRAYVEKIVALLSKYQGDPSFGTGVQVGDLTPRLAVSDGIVSTAGIDLSAGGTYAWGQCTWWAAIRRAQIGRPVAGRLGNGGDWGDNAKAYGYQVSGSPRPGDAVSFAPGALGADRTYGHVAVVESVHGDGGILISEANAKGVGIVSTREISAAQLASAGDGIQFIH